MANDPIDLMYAEHDIICKAQDVIKDCDGLWLKDEPLYVKTVNNLSVFFREYADGFHHQKEEQVLFPAIKNHPDFTLQEIIDEFENHHESFRDYTKEIELAIANADLSGSYKILNEYCNDLLDHIAAENEEHFVLASNLLSEEELERIYFQFKDIDLMHGEARKKELESLPDQLGQSIAQ